MHRRKFVALMCGAGFACVSLGQEIGAQSAIMVEPTTGRVLYAKDPDAIHYPASTTKIMTALLVLENCKLDDVIAAPWDITKTKESSMHLKPSEQVKVKDMLYALMLRSANDGCVACAVHIAGSVPAFAQMMNDKAKALGCTHTHFVTPNGLHNPDHFTTARDLSIIAREAMKNETFREIVKTQKYEIERSINLNDKLMVNRNKWLFKDPSADGIKTGFTNAAKHTYVGSATRNGFQVIDVLMADSSNWQADHKALLDMAFSKYEMSKVLNANQESLPVAVQNGQSATVPSAVAEPVTMLLDKSLPVEYKLEPKELKAPVKAGDDIGTLVISNGDYKTTVALKAAKDVGAKPSPVIIAAGVGAPALLLMIIGTRKRVGR